MLTRIHIAVSESPLTSGVEQEALCGLLIPKAQWIWTAEHGEKAPKEIFNPLILCQKCWRAEWNGHYVYGVVAGSGEE